MVRRKKRYLLLDNILTKDRCKTMNLYLIENDDLTIVRCNLSDLPQIKSKLEYEGIRVLSISGTLKSLRERKYILKESSFKR